MTQRIIAAMRNPHVDIIGHPTGRIIGERAAMEFDFDAVLEAAAAGAKQVVITDEISTGGTCLQRPHGSWLSSSANRSETWV